MISDMLAVLCRRIIYSTISTIQSSGNSSNGVNIHVAFVGNDANYYEAGMYYGSFTSGGGSGYNPNVFQFAWGKGGQILGVSSITPVAGHQVEISLIYISSASRWEAWFNDKNTGQLQTMAIGSSSVSVASDTFIFAESNGFGPNSNTQTLGLVTVQTLLKATRVAGDGVTFSNWDDAYVNKNCVGTNNASYGVTYLGTPGNFQIGYNGATKSNGAQIW
ncbi:hypothetical protein [Nitrososphaera viennensis]|nr:hypothetical protein [Nitrososphaera viennensis]